MDHDNDAPIVVVGSGVAGVATLINTLVQLAHSSPKGSPTLAVVLLGTREPGHKANTPYPLNGRSARDLHPFDSNEILDDSFWTFGRYVDYLSADDPSLRSALPAPTWQQIERYVEFMLDMAIVEAGSKAEFDVTRTVIKDIQPTTQDGPATIVFADDTTLHARRVIRAKDPPHMAGEPIDPVLLVAMEVHVALSASGLQFAFAHERDAMDPFTFTITVGSRHIVAKPLDLPDAQLCSHVSNNLLPRLRQDGSTELWVVTQYTVGESVPASFKGEPVKFLALWQFAALMEKMKLLGGGTMQTS